MSGYQVGLSNFVINSGSGGVTSSILTMDDTLDKVEELTIYAPSTLTGTVNLQINWTGSFSASEWRNAVFKDTVTSITVPAGGSVTFETHAAEGYRLSSSVAEAGVRTFRVLGAYQTEVKTLP